MSCCGQIKHITKEIFMNQPVQIMLSVYGAGGRIGFSYKNYIFGYNIFFLKWQKSK